MSHQEHRTPLLRHRTPRKRVLFVFATGWDRRQLEACRSAWETRFEVFWAEPTDAECPWNLDVAAWVARTARAWRGRIDGVLSSSDYPGATLAAALARELGLPGPDPAAVIRASHKYVSRQVQGEAAPEAVPPFDLVDPARPERAPATGFPCFVKPVKGAFSLLARRVDRAEDLRAFLARPAVGEFLREWMPIFNQCVRRYTDLEHDGRYFIAEGLLAGRQVTVEGFAVDGEVEILGVVDSVMYPGTSSFARFDYPSSFDEAQRERMRDLARRTVGALGLERAMFNVEMIVDEERDEVAILEVNPRLCGQFADLYELVHGVNGYVVAMELATGGTPALVRGAGPYRASASFPLRIFEPVRVVRAPDTARIREVEAAFPGTHVWSECEVGQELSDFERLEDGSSFRYAVVNTGAEDHPALLERAEAVRAALGFEFEPL